MKDYEKVKGSNCSRFTNAAHLGFHQRVANRLDLIADLSKVHITTELDEYKGCINDEKDRTRESRSTEKTVALSEVNQQRERIIPFITQTMAAAEWSPIEDVKLAGRVMRSVFGPYKNLQRERDDEKTALITSMVHDFEKPEYAAHIEALHLTETLQMLENLNNRYIQLREERLKEALAHKQENSKVLRQRTDAVYVRITELIYASLLLETVDDNITVINTLMRDLNGIIDEFNSSFNISKGIKKANKDRKPSEEEEDAPTDEQMPTTEE